MERKNEAGKIEIKPHQYISIENNGQPSAFDKEIASTVFHPDKKSVSETLGENHPYTAYYRRKKILCKSMGLSCNNITFREDEYLEFDLLKLAQNIYGADVASYMQYNCNPNQLISSLLNPDVFSLEGETPLEQWQVRISLLDMDDSGYAKLGKEFHRLMDQLAVLAKKATYHTRNEMFKEKLEYKKKW